jgi:hypothetical protein
MTWEMGVGRSTHQVHEHREEHGETPENLRRPEWR